MNEITLQSKRFLCVLAAGLLLVAGRLLAADDGLRMLGIDDYDATKHVGEPQLSPDGKLVAYNVDGQILVVPLAGGEPRNVTTSTSTAWSPQWSADGKSLYFLSSRSGKTQLWKLPVATFGEAEQVTDLDRGVSSIEFTQDESQLLLSYDDVVEKKDDDEPQPWVINRTQMKQDAEDGYLTAPESDHLYRYDIATKALTQITNGRFAEHNGAWSPDGSKVAFSSNREADPDASYRADIWVAAARNPSAEPLRLSDGKHVSSDPAFSPDGKQVAWLSDDDSVYSQPQILLAAADGSGNADNLTETFDHWVTDYRWSADGKYLYVQYDIEGGRGLARIRLHDRKIESVLDGKRLVSAFDIDRHGNLVVRAAGGTDIQDLYRVRNGKFTRLTDTNREFFAGLNLGDKRKIRYTVADGTLVEAFVTLPPGYEDGKRYPTILNMHGGPVGQFTWGYNFSSQYLARNGFVVVEPNPRGSTGRGQDFVNAIYRTWGITDLPDVLGGIDRAVELGIADPDRLFVTGYSYGGYMTNVVITHSTRFRAAATGAGESLIEANYGHDIYQKWYNWELGPPSLNRERYDALSPFLHVQDVTTPTLFLGGRQDWNVPILNAELMYQGLKQQGIETRLVVYPGMHHSGWTPKFDKDYLQRVVEWFNRHDR